LSKVIRVRYEGGVLKPLAPLELKEGAELVLEVKEVSDDKGVRKFFGIIKTGEESLREDDYYEYVAER